MWLWYASRAFGIVSLVLLSAVMVLGLLTSGRYVPRRLPAFVTVALHRSLSLPAVLFVALHVATAVLDGYVALGWLDAVVPFAAGYRPLWVGLGTVALDLVIALIVTSLLRRRLGAGVWRAVHWTAYACWPVALVHGLGTGTDNTSAMMLGPVAACVLAVAAAAGWRIGLGRRRLRLEGRAS